MTLKEELEILRGAPIKTFDGDPLSIPCIETSDVVQLCKHPVVSVHMLAYNHEPYIRQAIEGVMMQKTDFEFELVIGEDCSKDKTREICFEYQKKFPDKIRVLWWHENVSKFGGNVRRVTARCRGEFIAFCEGDDYWIDSLKLQKQVDVMRKYSNVGFCFCGAQMYWVGSKKMSLWNKGAGEVYGPGMIKGSRLFLTHIFGVSLSLGHYLASSMFMTASVMIRHASLEKALTRFQEIFSYGLRQSDSTMWLAITSVSDGYYLADEVSVYRQVATGMCQTYGFRVHLDGVLVRLYYLHKVLGLRIADVCVPGFDEFINDQGRILGEKGFFNRVKRMWTLIRYCPSFVFNRRYVLLFVMYLIVGYGRYVEKISNRILSLTKKMTVSKKLEEVINDFDSGYLQNC